MKKLFSVLLTLILLVALFASCGKKDAGPVAASDDQTTASASDDPTSAAAPEDAQQQLNAEGETYDVGDFTVYVPAGWAAIPVNSQDEPGTVSTNEIKLCKGAEYDAASETWVTAYRPSIIVDYLSGDKVGRVPGSKVFYDSTEDIAEMQIGSLTWQGFEYKNVGNGAIIWALAENYGYRLSIIYEDDLTLDDADLRAVMESLV
ncbi:MAG: hypothetical protein IJK89_01800 [Clostridia bacterium]|nr:hypothetical protein [Clostridia bacterium]